MPFTGEVDLTGILAKLGDDSHGLQPAARLNTEEQTEGIFRASWGAVDMSSSVALNGVPRLVWDVNGYYRDLGIGWPFKPSKSDLRVAYHQKKGWESHHLTYVLKQLLDPEVRAKYDARPLGKFMRDRYVIAAEMRALSRAAAKESSGRGEVITVGDLIREDEEKFPSVDPQKPVRVSDWNWGYYLLKSREYESTNLIKWQEMLVREFAVRGMVVVVSIGYIGETRKKFDVHSYDGHTIIFLAENEEPTIGLAGAAVSEYQALNREKDK